MHPSSKLLLSGRIVLPDGDARQRHMLVEDGRIRWLRRSRPPSAWLRGAKQIVTEPQDWIFPGLSDLHTHSWYNLLPLWDSPRAPFDHRHIWRKDPGYKAAIGGVLKRLDGHIRARKVFSELQAVAGGTTLLDEPRPLDAEDSQGATLLCRDTGSPDDLGLPEGRTIASVVDFFKPDDYGRPVPAPGWGDKPSPLDQYVAERASRQATLVHLAEGRSGFGSYRGADPYSRAEFEAFMAHPAMADAEAVRASKLVIVHGCGIDVEETAHIDFLLERDISILWSPASNMLLYDDTLDVEALIDRGVTVALGSDWSPSGSKHVWEEAKLARFFLRAIGSTISDAQIFRMVTSNPGHCLGLPRLGTIEEGALADFFILRSPIESDSALEVFFNTEDRDVLATLVNGLPIYGDKKFLKPFDLELQNLPSREGSAVRGKAVHLPASAEVTDFASQLSAVEDQMKSLDPPVLRSNLLVSSDVPYQRRLQFLRSRIERFGWTARRRRRKGAGSSPGRVPVAPASARIWWGKAEDRDELGDFLFQTWLPALTSLGKHGGLTACLFAQAPDGASTRGPDAVGLTFYESRAIYERARSETVAGRLLGLTEEKLLLGQGSWTGSPKSFRDKLQPRMVYSLIADPADWYHGTALFTCLACPEDGDPAAFRAAILKKMDGGDFEAGVDAALVAVGNLDQGENAVVVCRYVAAGEPFDLGSFDDEPDVEVLWTAQPGPMDAKGGSHEAWAGLEADPANPSRAVNLIFSRRALMLW